MKLKCRKSRAAPVPPELLSNLLPADILNSMPDGVYITDLERRIVFWNRAAEAITGWTTAEVVGKSCFDNILVHMDKDGRQLCGEEFCPLHRAIVTGRASVEAVLVFAQSKSGRRVPVEVSVAPIHDARGAVVGGIEVFRDLSAAEEDLRCAQMIQQQSLAAELPEVDLFVGLDDFPEIGRLLQTAAAGGRVVTRPGAASYLMDRTAPRTVGVGPCLGGRSDMMQCIPIADKLDLTGVSMVKQGESGHV